LGLIVLLLILRVRQITARVHGFYSERMSERARVARDLHDTVLQGSVGISLQMRAAVSQVPDELPAKPVLERIVGSMRQLIEDERNALEGLRSTNLDSSLEQSLATVAENAHSNGLPKYRSRVEGVEVELHPAIRNEAYSVGREALLNAFRHAHAGNVELKIEYQTAGFRLIVRDDGRGIDRAILRHGRSGHWGLPGMRERVDRINGDLRIVSDAVGGTVVDLFIPATIAYQGKVGGRVTRLMNWMSISRRSRRERGSNLECRP
jgi:signal transduction histidine kinase